MCLLDTVVDWSDTSISCSAISHRDPANPLRAEARLGAANGIEYAAQAMAPCQVLCAFDASFGAGLLDALGQVVVDGQPTLLIAYDSEYPEPLHGKRKISDCGGVALLLTPARTRRSLVRIAVMATTEPAQALADAELEGLRQNIPAMRSLPLLANLARGEPGQVRLDYLAPMQLNVTLQQC